MMRYAAHHKVDIMVQVHEQNLFHQKYHWYRVTPTRFRTSNTTQILQYVN